MCEAAAVVGDPDLKARVEAQAVKMARTALDEGLDNEGAMRYEKTSKGYSSRISWWPQCETIIGAVNAWQLTGDRRFFDAAVRNWAYVKAHLVDQTNGGWYKDLDEQGKPSPWSPKASEWNCPYHNSRMGYELAERLLYPAVHTEVMAWSNMTGVRLEGELIDFESTLRVGTPGGEMEKSGREKQQKIRYMREGNTQRTITPMHGVEVTQSVTDVDMHTVQLSWKAEAKEDLKEGVYFCMNFSPEYYSKAKIKTSGRKVTIESPERKITLTFDCAVDMFCTSRCYKF